MLKAIIVAAGVIAGGMSLTTGASAMPIGAALVPEAAAITQPAHFGYGGWGGGYGYRNCWRPRHSWGYGGYDRPRHRGWGYGGYGGGYGWGGRGYF